MVLGSFAFGFIEFFPSENFWPNGESNPYPFAYQANVPPLHHCDISHREIAHPFILKKYFFKNFDAELIDSIYLKGR